MDRLEKARKFRDDLNETWKKMKGNWKNPKKVTKEIFLAHFNDFHSAVEKILDILAEFYSYLRQPFLDLRETSLEKFRNAELILESPDFGDRIKEEFKEILAKHRREFEESNRNILDLQLEYFKETVEVFQNYQQILQNDAKLAKSLSADSNLLEKLAWVEEFLALQMISSQNAIIVDLKLEKQKILDEIQNFDFGSSTVNSRIQAAELELYSVQQRLLENKLKMLNAKQKFLCCKVAEMKQNYELVQDLASGLIAGIRSIITIRSINY